MISHYELTKDYTDYQLEGEDFQQMLRDRYKAFSSIPDQPAFIVPERLGNYSIQPGDWITGTGHMARFKYLILERHKRTAKEAFDHLSWVMPSEFPHIPDIDVVTFTGYRIDDFIRFNGRILKDHYEWYSAFVPLDDCMTEIKNSWQVMIKIWKIPTPPEVIKIKGLTLFDLFDS